MKKIKVNILSVAAALACVVTAIPISAQEPSKINFLTNYAFHGRHAPYFVGLEKGYYKEAGFDISIAPATGSGFVVTAVDAGQADYGMADASTVVQAIGKGASVKGFMVYMDSSTSGLASLKPFESPEDLKDAKIAASQTDSARVVLPIIYKQRSLDSSKIQWETADPSVYMSLLASGQADLITASIDGDVPALQRTLGKSKDVHFSSFSSWGYDVFGYLLIAKRDSLKQNPEQAKRFAQATKKAVEYSMAHPEETAKIMVKHNPALNAETTLAQWKQSIKAMQTPYVRDHGYGTATNTRLDRTISLMAEALNLSNPPSVDDAFFEAIPAK